MPVAPTQSIFLCYFQRKKTPNLKYQREEREEVREECNCCVWDQAPLESRRMLHKFILCMSSSSCGSTWNLINTTRSNLRLLSTGCQVCELGHTLGQWWVSSPSLCPQQPVHQMERFPEHLGQKPALSTIGKYCQSLQLKWRMKMPLSTAEPEIKYLWSTEQVWKLFN